MKTDALTAFGYLMLGLFRRAPRVERATVPASSTDEMDALRIALERQIAADERSRTRWGDHG